MPVSVHPTPTFATFWQGELSGFEAACIHSFLRRGYELTVYSYEPVAGLPAGAATADAAAIVPASVKGRFLFRGKPHLSHFSDYFRYKLFEKTDAIWVDTDMLLVRPFDRPLPATFLPRERQSTICGAVLRLAKDERLARVIAGAEAAMDRDLVWGETGPALLSREFDLDALSSDVVRPERFFSIDHDNFWKVMLPSHAAECEAMTADSWGVHLWNNVVARLGIWKKFAPPQGSYLHTRWAEDDALGYFADTYPAKVMEQIVENWRLRQSGDALGIAAVTRQVVPSVGRTLRHYAGPDLSLSLGLSRLRTRFLQA